MKKIVITGSNGAIGSALTTALAKDYEIVGVDLPDGDVLDYDYLLGQMQGADVVIHLAHASDENWRSGSIEPVNVQMEMNVFSAVVQAKVGRLIMASSVHADNFLHYDGDALLSVPGSYHPVSLYGAHKLIAEETGKFYALRHSFEFIGVRFGGVTKDGKVNTLGKEPLVWLSHRDLTAAITACIEAREVPGSFALFYAVSRNMGKVHSTDNPFGWEPRDNSADFMSL